MTFEVARVGHLEKGLLGGIHSFHQVLCCAFQVRGRLRSCTRSCLLCLLCFLTHLRQHNSPSGFTVRFRLVTPPPSSTHSKTKIIVVMKPILLQTAHGGKTSMILACLLYHYSYQICLCNFPVSSSVAVGEQTTQCLHPCYITHIRLLSVFHHCQDRLQLARRVGTLPSCIQRHTSTRHC